MLIYVNEIIRSLEINLPVVTKYLNNKLVLRDYTLDSGHFAGLSEAIRQTKLPAVS